MDIHSSSGRPHRRHPARLRPVCHDLRHSLNLLGPGLNAKPFPALVRTSPMRHLVSAADALLRKTIRKSGSQSPTTP